MHTVAYVALAFVKEIVNLHMFPFSIDSERSNFMSQFWKEWLRHNGMKLLYNTSYHPQTHGHSEIVNKALETYLRCLLTVIPKYRLVGYIGLYIATTRPPTHLPRRPHFKPCMDSTHLLSFVLGVRKSQ